MHIKKAKKGSEGHNEQSLTETRKEKRKKERNPRRMLMVNNKFPKSKYLKPEE